MTERPVAVNSPTRLGRIRRTTLALGLLLVVGLAVRILVVQSNAYVFNSDTAVVYLMARHVAHGEIPAFFWGQFYGGTLLQITAGLVMMLVGPSLLTLAVVSALFWAAAALVLRAVVARSLGTTAGDLAATLFWFPGAIILGTSVADPGFYGPTMLIGLLAIWWALRWASARPWWSWLVLGLLGGLALWTSPVAVAFAAPGVVLAALRDPRWRMWLLFAGAAVVAASAWIWGTVAGHLASIKPLGGLSLHPESFASIFTTMFPAAFPGGRTELGGFVIALATLTGIVALCIVAVRRRDAGLLLMAASTILVIGILVGGTGVRLAADSVRYSGYLIPGLATIVSLVLVRVGAAKPTGRLAKVSFAWVPLVAGGIAVVVTIGLVGQQTGGFRPRSKPPIDADLVRVGQLLEDQGVQHAYGSYWAAYALSAATDERVTVASLAPRRYEPYEKLASRRSPEVIVVFAGAYNDSQLQSLSDIPPHTRTVVGGYAVYMFDRWFDPEPRLWSTF